MNRKANVLAPDFQTLTPILQAHNWRPRPPRCVPPPTAPVPCSPARARTRKSTPGSRG